MRRTTVDCYCAFCRNPRRIYRKKSLGFWNYLQAFGLAALTSVAFWHTIDPKAIVIAIIYLILIETAILLRRRAEVPCPHCGFDAVLYSRNKAAACERVKKHIEGRQNDPDVWLARKPPIRAGRPRKSTSTRELIV